MKNRVFIIIFILSIIINLTVLTTAGYYWMRSKNGYSRAARISNVSSADLYRKLGLSKTQIEKMESIKNSFSKKMREKEKITQELRLDLINVLKKPKVDREKINEIHSKIENSQKK